MNRSFVLELTDEESKLLLKDFKTGRPFNFEAPAVSQGFSLHALLENILARFGLCENIPIWVRERVVDVHEQLIESAMILPYVVRLPYPPIRYIEKRGTEVFAKGRDGKRRIAVLFSNRRFWVIALWDVLSGVEIELPSIGEKIYLPIEYDKIETSNAIKKAIEEAEFKINKVQ